MQNAVANEELAAPVILGLLGEAGSGKDTVADMILDCVEGERVLLAGPLKEFARDVFDFSEAQLYGPSEMRNEADPRYSFNHPIRKSHLAKKTLWQRVRNFFSPIEHPYGYFTSVEINDNRQRCWWRFYAYAGEWLNDVLPPEADYAMAYDALESWMENVMETMNISPRYVLQTLGTEWGRTVHEDIWIDRAIRVGRELVSEGVWCVITDVRFVNEARKIRDAGGEIWRICRYQSGLTGTAGTHPSEMEQKSPEMNLLVDMDVDNNGSIDDLRSHVEGLVGYSD